MLSNPVRLAQFVALNHCVPRFYQSYRMYIGSGLAASVRKKPKFVGDLNFLAASGLHVLPVDTTETSSTVTSFTFRTVIFNCAWSSKTPSLTVKSTV